MRKRIRGIRGLFLFIGQWGSTQLLVMFAWLFFRAKDLDQVGYFLNNILRWQGSELTGRFIMIILVFSGVTLAIDLVEYLSRSDLWLLKLRPATTAAVCPVVLFVVACCLATTRPLPFVYFQF